jgi:P-type E1-E2 ATPase
MEENPAEMAVKQCSYQNIQTDVDQNPDPILLQDSIVMSGTCKAVVLAVGQHTLLEKEIKANLKNDKYALQVEKDVTQFQSKLEILAGIVGAYAYTLCVAALVLFGIIWLIFVMASDYKLVEAVSIQRAIDLASTAIALLIVCIPEGMPLVISMAMAFSVDKLKGEHLLIKNLDALETAGQLSNIITGKTATLTNGDMQVARINIDNNTYRAEEFNCNIEI